MFTNKTQSTLYVGVTGDLNKRLSEHKAIIHTNSFTAKYNIEKLVYFEIIEGELQAIAREKQIKKYSRQKKNDLIGIQNPKWEELCF
jgi:putative endonuclease